MTLNKGTKPNLPNKNNLHTVVWFQVTNNDP